MHFLMKQNNTLTDFLISINVKTKKVRLEKYVPKSQAPFLRTFPFIGKCSDPLSLVHQRLGKVQLLCLNGANGFDSNNN